MKMKIKLESLIRLQVIRVTVPIFVVVPTKKLLFVSTCTIVPNYILNVGGDRGSVGRPITERLAVRFLLSPLKKIGETDS